VKKLTSHLLTVLFALANVIHAQAQSPESIWLSAINTTYKTGETVLVAVNADSVTPIQGFTFQIRYDPACLRPINASSPVPGMNGLQLPQLSGVVDGSYASTTPQTVNGVLAEVRFTALQGCQTGLYLESAALAVRNAEGFATLLASVLVGERSVSLTIDREVGVSQSPAPDSGSILSLEPPVAAEQGFAGWIIGILIVLLFGGIGLGAYKFFRIGG
jgi:hypothetical protein